MNILGIATIYMYKKGAMMSADGNQDFLNEGAGRSGDMQQVDSL